MNLINELRCIAEDLYSANSASPAVSAMSKAADRIAELEAELEFDQRNAAMSQAESAKLLIDLDELAAQVAMLQNVITAKLKGFEELQQDNAKLREALQAAIKVHGYTSGVLVDALNATGGT